ncbi:hypothetical protein GCM10010389_66250 [Streptomyces echinoruber]|uniref:Uncharacterized protein n=1 Tax=Streptomyces echinoruber TaxID=68898 RepID=A0A918VS27_9ACTN|nr:hypothetical protein GCM10010389_66250 [Streptomyces echinoruber]
MPAPAEDVTVTMTMPLPQAAAPAGWWAFRTAVTGSGRREARRYPSTESFTPESEPITPMPRIRGNGAPLVGL